MAKICTECGKEIPDGVAFCTECGTKAPADTPQATPQEAASAAPKCQKCGAALKEGTAFCTECGAPTKAETPPNTQEAAPTVQDEVKPQETATPQAAPPPPAQPQYTQPAPQQPTYQQPPRPTYQQPPQPTYQQPQAYAAPQPPADASGGVVGTGTFFGTMLLFALPVIGFLACLLMCFIPKRKSLKNYARANLIWAIIGFVFGILVIIGVIALGNALIDYLTEALNSGLGDLSGLQ